MQLINPNFTQKSMQLSVNASYSLQDSQEILTLEDLVEILEQLNSYLQDR